MSAGPQTLSPSLAAVLHRPLALGFIAQAALCWPLWVGSPRSFGAGVLILDPVSLALSLLLLGVTAAYAMQPSRRVWALLWLGLMGLLFVLHPDRLQPWVFFYVLAMTAGLSKQPRAALAWLIAGVYGWSGISKITPWFAEDNWSWFCGAFAWSEPLGAYAGWGYAAAMGEALFGFLLLWRVTRPAWRYVAPLFHAWIVVALSPLGLDWNAVVIPWNLCMAWMVWHLFEDQKAFHWPGLDFASGVALGLGVVAPAWFYLGLWPYALSWTMYSNTQPEAGFYMQYEGAKADPPHPLWKQYALPAGDEILYDDLCLALFRVPVLQTAWRYRQLTQQFCPLAPPGAEAGMRCLVVKRWDKDHLVVVREKRCP